MAGPAADQLRELRGLVAAAESRASGASDLPPLGPEAHEVAKAGLRLLRYRPRSAHELRERLLAAEHPPTAVDEAVARLRAWGLLDDAEFAAEWVRGRRRRRGKSAGALRRELRDKGVADQHIDAAVADIGPAEERERALELVRARCRRRPGPPSADELTAERRKLAAFLARRGFATGLALGVVDEVLAEQAAESAAG